MRAEALAALATVVACSSEGALVISEPLSEGDAVVLFTHVEDAARTTVTLLRAGPGGAVEASAEAGALAAAAVIHASDVVDLEGRPKPLEDLEVDLDGDRGAGCGCGVLPIDRRQVVSPGDRCPLPSAVAIGVASLGSLDEAVTRELRARARLEWPGSCGCSSGPETSSAKIEVCPLGEGAERLVPTRMALGPDGTVHLVARTMAVSYAPGGERFELPIEPPIAELRGLFPRIDGSALLVAAVSPTRQERAEHLEVPARGAGRVTRAAGYDDASEVDAALLTPDGELYLARDDGERLRFDRCRLGASGPTTTCRRLTPPRDPACPQHEDTASGTLVRLDGGDAVFVSRTGAQLYLAGDEVLCVPGTRALTVAAPGDGPELTVSNVISVAATGRRLLACAIAEDARERVALVVTATVGALPDARVVWRAVHQEVGRGSACPELAFNDPARGGAAIVGIASDFGQGRSFWAASATTTLLRRIEEEGLFPGLDERVDDVVSSSAAVAVLSNEAEAFVRDAPGARFRALEAAGTRGSRDIRAALPVPEGFLVYSGGVAPLLVRVTPELPGCEAARVELPADPTPSAGELRDDFVVRFGDGKLVFRRDSAGAFAELRDANDRVERRIDGIPSRVDGAVELSRGRWALFVTQTLELLATDGRAAVALDPRPIHRRISGRAGIAWAAGDASLSRITLGPDGSPRVEDAWPAIDHAAFDALPRSTPPVLTALRAFCDGSLLLAYHEDRSVAEIEIEAVSAWTLRSRSGVLALEPYAALSPTASRPIFSQTVGAIAGSPRIPVMSFSGSAFGEGLHAPGVVSAALPFNRVSTLFGDGLELLAGGPAGRVALVRVREAAP